MEQCQGMETSGVGPSVGNALSLAFLDCGPNEHRNIVTQVRKALCGEEIDSTKKAGLVREAQTERNSLSRPKVRQHHVVVVVRQGRTACDRGYRSLEFKSEAACGICRVHLEHGFHG
jgi:hypothetical protein